MSPEVFVDIVLIKYMIAGSHHVDAVAKQFIGKGRRHTKTGSRILTIRNHNIDRLGRTNIGHMVANNPPARKAKDIADEEKLHGRPA